MPVWYTLENFNKGDPSQWFITTYVSGVSSNLLYDKWFLDIPKVSIVSNQLRLSSNDDPVFNMLTVALVNSIMATRIWNFDINWIVSTGHFIDMTVEV